MSRARAHYGWAKRYSKQGEVQSSIAHLSRSMHYTGFGADPDLKSWDEMFRKFTKFVVSHASLSDSDYKDRAKVFYVTEINDRAKKQEYEKLRLDTSNILADWEFHASLPDSLSELTKKHGQNLELGWYDELSGELVTRQFYENFRPLEEKMYDQIRNKGGFMARKL